MKSTIHEFQKNNLKLVSKTNFKSIAILFFGITTFVSCNNEDDAPVKNYTPSAATFIALKF